MLGESNSNGTISGIETGRNVPNIDTAERIARALGVSPGWLAFGRATAAPGHEPGDTLRCDGIGQRIAELRQALGLSRKALAERCKVSRAMLLYVEEGRSVASITTAEQIAAALGVSPAWLAYGELPRTDPKRGRRKAGEGEGPSEG